MAKRKRSSIVKELDKWFSLFIRLRHADEREFAKCITCNKVAHYKELQCGHFMSRKHYATRWDEVNCQVQCSGCNVFRYGEQYKFSKWLDENYKEGTSEALHIKSNEVLKLSDSELLDKIQYYKEKVSKLI